jgi:hypothetical protein
MKIPGKFQKYLDEFAIVSSRKIAITTEGSYRTWITKYLVFLDTARAREIEKSERKFDFLPA